MDELEKASAPAEYEVEPVRSVQVTGVSTTTQSVSVSAAPSGTLPKGRWWASLSILTLLAIVFYAQGRLFTDAYLDYFGLNSSQFPVSPDDAYWYAFMGWGMVAGKGPGAILRGYPSFLAIEWVPILVSLAIPVISLFGRKFDWWSRIGNGLTRFRNWVVQRQIAGRPSKEVAKHVAIGGFPALLMASMPLMFLALTLFLAFLIAIFVLPFWNLGQRQARADCQTAASSHQVVNYMGELTQDASSGKSLAPARLLQCGPEFCALIRDGESLVIPRAAIQSVFGKPIGQTKSLDHVPKNLQFCPRTS
jgi:hypothetical protein